MVRDLHWVLAMAAAGDAFVAVARGDSDVTATFCFVPVDWVTARREIGAKELETSRLPTAVLGTRRPHSRILAVPYAFFSIPA